MTAEGNYDPSRSYDKLAVVAYNGLSWVSRKKVPEGVAPSEANSAFWQKISERGERGPQGQSYVDKELVPIVDDLTTGGSANVLSAEQGKILKEELSELESKIKEDIAEIKPITIVGDVVNAADEEDIASINNLLKLKDRDDSLGLGYVILRPNKSVESQISRGNTIYEIRYDFDFNGNVLHMPSNSTLKFNGGMFSNVTIVGNSTTIEAGQENIFYNVKFEGAFICCEIYSEWIKDIESDNQIRQLFNLSSDTCHNSIYINDGVYNVSVLNDAEGIIQVSSNTDVYLNGTIKLLANSFGSYYVIIINKKTNIHIQGGQIIGDKDEHLGTSGEWGHGFYIMGSDNITISGTRISHCWGDGIAIGGDSLNTNIVIKNSNINNCRRQGISVIYAKNCSIENNCISDIRGTLPEFCIDVEPNADGYCDNIKIIGNTLSGKHGILLTDQANYIKNCLIADNHINVSNIGYQDDSSDVHIFDGNVVSCVTFKLKKSVAVNNILNITRNGRSELININNDTIFRNNIINGIGDVDNDSIYTILTVLGNSLLQLDGNAYIGMDAVQLVYLSSSRTNTIVATNNIYPDSMDISNMPKLVKGRYKNILNYGNSRPVLKAKDVGLSFFDDTIKKPIWWNGTAWVDATGANV